jgi:hypothetical protein
MQQKDSLSVSGECEGCIAGGMCQIDRSLKIRHCDACGAETRWRLRRVLSPVTRYASRITAHASRYRVGPEKK